MQCVSYALLCIVLCTTSAAAATSSCRSTHAAASLALPASRNTFCMELTGQLDLRARQQSAGGHACSVTANEKEHGVHT